jgi:hypothetical protein
MPEIEIAQYLPTSPVHTLTIFHYLILLLSIGIFATTGEEAPMAFLVVVAALMLITALHLYIDLVRMDDFVIFLLKTATFVLPVMLAGLAPTSEARGLAILAAMFGLGILAAGLTGCLFPSLMDPRSLLLCQ